VRLWSLHPRYLDRQGLTACWREALLAQAVLAGRTRGYRSHPQLERFRATPDPIQTVGAYLSAVADEASARGYSFDRARIEALPSIDETRPGNASEAVDGSEPERRGVPIVTVTRGQLDLEWQHLLAKLRERSPELAARWQPTGDPEPHPLLTVVPGDVEPWERTTLDAAPPTYRRTRDRTPRR
jgi:hypothetical protein